MNALPSGTEMAEMNMTCASSLQDISNIFLSFSYSSPYFFNHQSLSVSSVLLCSPCALLVLSTQLSVLRDNKSVFPIWLQSRRDKYWQNKKLSRNSWTIRILLPPPPPPPPLSSSLSLSLNSIFNSKLLYWHDCKL